MAPVSPPPPLPPGFARPPWRASRRRAALAVALAVALGVAVVLLIGRATQEARLLDRLGEAEYAWLAVGVFGQVVAYTGYVMAFRDSARVDGGPVLDVRTAAQVVVAGFGALVAASTAGGLAVQYWALNRAGAPPREAIRRVIALNALEWLWLGAAACVAAVALLLGVGHPASLGVILPWLIVVPCCLAAAAWVTSARRVDRLTRPAAGGRMRRLLADAIAATALVRTILRHAVRYPAGVLGFPLYWMGGMVCLWAALRAFGGHIGVPELVLGYATGYAAQALPLPVGGAGGVDAAMTYALTLVGMPLSTALLGVIAYRVITFWLPLVPALVLIPRLRHLHDQLPRARREAPLSVTAG
jgi:uncharacterized membrane protein YbhN (UPF0104 family)